MKFRRRLFIVSTVLISIFLQLFSLKNIVVAQTSTQCANLATFKDLDFNGTPDMVIFDCHFTEGTNDQIFVFDGRQEMSWDADWRSVVDLDDDTWIFDHDSDNLANLIISFSRQGDQFVAELFDDRDGDGRVAYEIVDGQVKITENENWTIRMEAAEGWWLADGQLNTNLHILVDGDVEVTFGSENYRKSLSTDGQVDFEIEVRDKDGDDLPETDRRWQHIPWLQKAVGQGTQMTVNWVDDEPAIEGGFQLWPYLDLYRTHQGGSRIIKDYNTSSPPIQYDPGTGRLEAVGEFVASRGGEHNCWYYSTIRWQPSVVNDSNFESPFCLYDLASDGDGFPELLVRSLYWLPHDFSFLNGRITEPMHWIRYSWDQENANTWRYGLGLFGNNLVSETTYISDIAVRTIPYEEYPYWVTDREWDTAVFVEVMRESYWTSEGTYLASYISDGEFADYFAGLSTAAPSIEIQPEPGFRVEWASKLDAQPLLYMSNVDHRLHLIQAQGGSWQVDASTEVQYDSNDDGRFINSWKVLEEGNLASQLILHDGFLLFNENGELILATTSISPSLFETLPPRDHGEWISLQRQMDEYIQGHDPIDLRRSLDELGNPFIHIYQATLRDFRPTADGFRFVLELGSRFRVQGQDPLDLQRLEAGAYLITYDGSFKVDPLSPPNLAVTFIGSFAEKPLDAYVPDELHYIVQNTGLEDASGVLLTISATHSDIALPSTITQTVDILAEQSLPVRFIWTPSTPGQWDVTLKTGPSSADQGNVIFLGANNTVSVVQPAEPGPAAAFSAFGLVFPAAIVILLLSAVVIGGILAYFALLSSHHDDGA